MEEINDLHARLIDNLRLAMSVFLNDNVRDAKKLLEEKTRFRELERDYAAARTWCACRTVRWPAWKRVRCTLI